MTNNFDYQKDYWDSVADKKTFTHPIQINQFREQVAYNEKILDYGCGYGRTVAYLQTCGYQNVIGVDISPEMIKRGKQLHNNINLHCIEDEILPFPNNTFSACTLMAVLTCVPTNIGQTKLISEIHRVLAPNGFLYLSDYPLQEDARNKNRYQQFRSEFNTFGVFRLPDGGIVRHHKMSWIYKLLSNFKIISDDNIAISTMNGNDAIIFQIIAQKT